MTDDPLVRSASLVRVARFAVLPLDSPAVLYLAGLSTVGSRTTMLAEVRRIARFFGHEPGTLEWHLLEHVHVVGLRTHVAETRAPAGANLTLAALRGVLRAAVRLRLMTEDRRRELVDVPPVRGSRELAGREVKALELLTLFRHFASDPSPCGARDAAALALMYGGGLRRAEAVSLDLEDLGVQAVAVLGKGNKARTVPLPEGALRAVLAWLVVRGDAPGPLLCPVLRWRRVVVARLHPASLYHSILRGARRAGLERFTPHDLRRTYVGDLLDAGADLATVQALAGHSSPVITARYDRRALRARVAAAARLVVPFGS